MSLEVFFLKVAPSVLSEIILQAGNRELKRLNKADIKKIVKDALNNHGLIGHESVFQTEIITALITSKIINADLQLLLSPFLVDLKKVIGEWWEARPYTIVSEYSGMMLGAKGLSKEEGIRIQQLDPSGGLHPHWKLVPVGALGQPYKIYSPHSEKVLTVGRLGDPASIQQSEYKGRPNQQWVLLPTDKAAKTFKIISVDSGKALDVDIEASNKKTAHVQQYSSHGRINQWWRLTYVQP